MLRYPSLLMIVAMLPAAPAGAADDDRPGTFYRLQTAANFQDGCFDPCLCPIRLHEMRGSFRLVPADLDEPFTFFDVTDVRFAIDTGGTANGEAGRTTLRGSGQYVVGGGNARQQQLRLELTDDAGDTHVFDSGLVSSNAPFPQIDVAAAVNGFYCVDQVVEVVARPRVQWVAAESDWRWDTILGALSYDVVGGDLSMLRDSWGDFSVATTHCPVSATTDTVAFLDEVPQAGDGLWYLLRYRDLDGGGSWDTDSPSQPVSRDASIAAASAACY